MTECSSTVESPGPQASRSSEAPRAAFDLTPADRADLADSRCLVTGGAGFIGSNLTRLLLDLGARVTVLDSFETGRREHLPESAGLRIVKGDLATLPDLASLVEDSDIVFHLAAQVGNVRSIEHPESDATTNVLGSVRLFRACNNARLRKVVYSSSSAIFGEAEILPIAEDHPRAPASFYALSKLAAEQYALLGQRLWGIPAVALRYFNVYGLPLEDSEYSGVISIFMNRLLADEPLVIYGDGLQVRDFVFVEDIARANVLAALRAPSGSVFNIGSGQATSVTELAETVMAVAERRQAIRYVEPRAGEVRRSVADISRARSELGFAPVWELASGLEVVWSRLRDGRTLL
jgi:UDP-glucose 4-epimerase